MAWRLRASRESRIPERRISFNMGIKAGIGFINISY
jgi:hypothetical protein